MECSPHLTQHDANPTPRTQGAQSEDKDAGCAILPSSMTGKTTHGIPTAWFPNQDLQNNNT